MGTAPFVFVRYPSPLTLLALRNGAFRRDWHSLFQIRARVLALALLPVA
jgi:hypothetical protein